MKRAFVWTISVLVIYLGATVGCTREHAVVDGDTVRTASSVTQVDIKFRGAIAHVFATTTDASPKPVNRAAFLLPNKNVDAMPVDHLSEMVLPDSVNVAELTAATGTGILVETDTDYHYTTVSPLDRLTIRLVGSDGSTTSVLEPALDKSDTDFIKQVPHLLVASNNTMKVGELRPELRNPAKAPDGVDFAAFFELEGGKYSSKPHCKPTKFQKDHGNQGMHDFGETIVLSGRLKKPPVLLISRAGGAPKAVHFVNPSNKLLIQLRNLPAKPEPVPHSHFEMFRRMATDPTKFTIPKNTWDDVVEIKCAAHGPIPGCSNSTWP